MGGIGVLVTDPEKYEKTVHEGLDIVWGRDNETVGDYAEAIGYTIVYIGAAPARAVASGVNWVGKKLSLWAEEDKSFRTETDFLGLDYHSVAAAAHRISISQ